MLPPLLSEHLCSLRAAADRFAVSAVWEVELTGGGGGDESEDGGDGGGDCADGGDGGDGEGGAAPTLRVLSTWFGRTLIR